MLDFNAYSAVVDLLLTLTLFPLLSTFCPRFVVRISFSDETFPSISGFMIILFYLNLSLLLNDKSRSYILVSKLFQMFEDRPS